MASDAEALMQLALGTLKCTQKELAHVLGVSQTQISKWKNGEHMSDDMEKKIRAKVGIGDKQPWFVVWAGSLEAANKWEKLIHFLADAANDDTETGYSTPPLDDDNELLCYLTFDTLRKMGAELPKTFPSEMDIDYDDPEPGEVDFDLDSNEKEPADEDVWERIDANPYASLIQRLYRSFTNVYGFYRAYVEDLVYDEKLQLMDTEAENIEPCLLDLAASKLDDADIETLAPRFRNFRFEVQNDYERWLNIVKDAAFRAGVPLRAELLDMVHESQEELRDEAEKQYLGFNDSRLHPDIYMNELLTGMRVIHQVLPAILEKLGIEFKLDQSELRQGPRPTTKKTKEEKFEGHNGMLQ